MTWNDTFSSRLRRALLRLGVGLTLAGGIVGAGAADAPWAAMDYGPFLTASIQMPAPRTNVAFKGIALNLGRQAGSAANESVVFDTDLLTYSVGWTGEFVGLKGIVFDGEHWAYPRALGTAVFANPSGPGWAGPGRSGFEDPRVQPYGPLPKEWAHWKGLFVADGAVVLSYTVGGMEVMERPGLEPWEGRLAFSRTLNLGPTKVERILQVAFEAGGTTALGAVTDPSRKVDLDSAAGDAVAMLTGGEDSDEVLAAWVRGDTAGLRWRVGDGHLRLQIPADSASRRVQLVVWRGSRRELAGTPARVAGLRAPADLKPLTRGGAASWEDRLVTRGRLGTGDGPYVIDELTAPEANPWKSWMRFSGMDFFPGGTRAAVSTWNGDVWVVSGVDGDLERLEWRRIAAGLFQPLGLKILEGDLYVLGRDQITRLRDLNGDGETDFYENFNNDALVSEHFHEFANDLKIGNDGDFYYVKCARHALPAVHAQHGSLIRVSRDGSRSEVVARGFRAVNGLGVGPDGTFTTIDNQGHWMPANRLNWVRPGGWYGNQFAWNPDGRTAYDEPLCWMHNSVDRSGGTQLWVPPGSAWGPLEGELITISYGMGQMFLVLKEQVGSVMQGAVTRFPLEFETGVMRGAFHPGNGQLYTCGLFGWAGNKTRAGGWYRVRHTGRPLHLARHWNVVKDGIVLGFTEPLDEHVATDPGNFDVKAWNYRWSAAYGSPDFRADGREGRDDWRVESATLSADRRSVFLKVPQVQRMMQCHVTFRLRAADGTAVENFIHGTIHQVGDRLGHEVLGPGARVRHDVVAGGPTSNEPGLIQRLRRVGQTDWTDARVARMPALYVAAGRSVSPFLEPGPFLSEWEGALALDLNEEVTFQLEGRGKARLWIEDRLVLEEEGAPWVSRSGGPVALVRGRNRLRLEYESPADGGGEIRLLWTPRGRATGPIPPTQWFHSGSDPLWVRQSLIRDGRRLLAERQCVACHQPEGAFGREAMPELAAKAPSLAGIGARWRGAWLAQWLADPVGSGAPGRMPRMFHGEVDAEDARDVAAYLASRTGEAVAGEASVHRDVSPRPRLFEELGCVGCHWMPPVDDRKSTALTSLSHVGVKWKPAALEAYLRNPGRHHPWTRMPDFQLTADEAAGLAAFLIIPVNRHQPEVPVVGDANRGAKVMGERGCLACHPSDGLEAVETSAYSRPARLADLRRTSWTKGCMATQPSWRGRAPDFRWTPAERRALEALREVDLAWVLGHDPAAEFAERQIQALSCAACHPRDGQTDVLTGWEALRSKARGGDDEEGGSVHVGRPPLTYAGEKLFGGWMRQFLAGTLPYKPRSALQGRMPAFPAYAEGLAAGMAAQHGYPMESARPMSVDPKRVDVGRALTQVEGGFACVTCHGVGDQPALAGKDTASVNFVHVSERLRASYYARYLMDPPALVPGTMMPKFVGDDGRTSVRSVHEGDPARQFEAVWHYLHSLGVSATGAGTHP